MKIAYQGEPGAYSEAAALRFSPNATTVPCESFDEVFAAVEGGKTTHGILPIENSIGGSIHRNYDLLLEHELPVVAEVLLQVSHNLLAFPGTQLEDIKKVYSHPQGLAQCEGFLSSLKGVEIVATYDTAGSAKMIRDKELKDAAAIASARAAEVFNLESLAEGIQDFKENITRFIVISKAAADPETADKTMIVFTLPNTPGRAVQGAQRVRAARDRFDEARVAPGARQGVRVSVLRRHRGAAAGSAVHARARSPRRVREIDAHARLVFVVEGKKLSDPMKPRSGAITDGPSRAPARAMLKAVGFTDADLRKPIIGVANTWIEIGPCNYHLRTLAEHVKEGIRKAGGTPMEFNTVSISDGITMGSQGMKTSLISRDLIADSIELVARGNLFDGLIALSGCDKTIPGTIMALARLDIPGVMLYGGSIAPGEFHGKNITIQDVFEAVGAHAAGRMSDADLLSVENQACPGAGACGGQFTANTMSTVGEFLGISAMGFNDVPALDPGEAAHRPRGRRAGDGSAEAQRAAAADHHARLRSTTRSRRWPPPADRPTRCCTCWRSRARPASS